MAEIPQSRSFMGSVRRWLGGRRGAVSQMPAPAAETAAAAAPADRRIEVMLAEWQDIRATLRHSDGARLIELAVFVVVLTAIVGGYLAAAALPDARLVLARWALPALGLLVSLVFLSLELGSMAHRRALALRGRQIETAMQILVPGIGRVRSLALILELGAGESGWEEVGAWGPAALYGLALLASIAALIAAAAGAG